MKSPGNTTTARCGRKTLFGVVATLILLSVLAFFAPPVSAQTEAMPNALTAQEKADGWKLLFDGKTLKGWRIFHSKTMTPIWQAENGAIVLKRDAKPGESGSLVDSLMTEEEFGDFELSVDWRIAPGANSGIFYHVSETGKQPNSTGIEYQILDNQRHPDAKQGLERQTGAAYHVYPPAKDVTRPIGEWNTARILVRGKRVEHWLNGEKLLEYELYSDDWLKRVAKSKFKNSATYGRSPVGHILLQDHGHHAEFRSLKLRVISAEK